MHIFSEIWKPIPGYEGYEASDQGRIRHVAILSPSKSKKGYLKVGVGSRDARSTQFVHRLVLLAFKGVPEKGQLTRHLDGDRLKNALSNLCWGTQTDNMQDAEGHGTAVKGSRVGTAKLTEGEVGEIKRSLAAGASQKHLATVFRVSVWTVRQIANGAAWKHVHV